MLYKNQYWGLNQPENINICDFSYLQTYYQCPLLEMGFCFSSQDLPTWMISFLRHVLFRSPGERLYLISINGGESKRLNRFQEEEEEKKDLANPHQRSQEIRQDRGFHNPFKKPVNQIEQQHYRKHNSQNLKLEEATSAFNNLNLNGDKAKKRVYKEFQQFILINEENYKQILKEIKNDDFQSDEEEEDFPEYLPNYSKPQNPSVV